MLLTLCAVFQCFSELSYVEGDTQQLQMVLNLVPAEVPTKTCSTLSGNQASFTIEMSDKYDGTSTVFEGQPFVYQFNVTNQAIVDISGLTDQQLTGLQSIYNAVYHVKIETAEEISGTINQLNFVKTDISACWTRAVLVYSSVKDNEFISFEITPANCYLPEDAVLSSVFVNTSTSEHVSARLPEFQAVAEADYYQQQPYTHTAVKKAILYCSEITSEEEKQLCYRVLAYIQESWDFQLSLRLDYAFNGFASYLTREADEYIAGTARECDVQSSARIFMNPLQFVVFHDDFAQLAPCVADGGATASFWLLLSAGEKKFEASMRMPYEEYITRNYIVVEGDFSQFNGLSALAVPQYVVYADDGDTLLLLADTLTPGVNCVDHIIFKQTGPQAAVLQFNLDKELQCTPISGVYKLYIMDAESQSIIQTFSVDINVDATTAISVNSVYLSDKIVQNAAIKQKKITFAIVGSDFVFVSAEIYLQNQYLGLLPSFLFIGIYILAGSVLIAVYIQRKKHSDE